MSLVWISRLVNLWLLSTSYVLDNITTKLMKKIIFLAAGLLLLAAACNSSYNSSNTNTQTPASSNSSATATGQIKQFTITAKNFSYTPNEIKVKKGDTVKITLQNTEDYHDWVLNQYNVKIPGVNAGKSASVQFVADKAGTFEFYCSISNHRQLGMKGNLIVQ